MNLVQSLREQLQNTQKGKIKIVFPEGECMRILSAVATTKDFDFLDAIVVGNRSKIQQLATEAKLDLNGVQIIDPQTFERLDFYAEVFSKRLKLPVGIVKALFRNVNNFAAAMVGLDDADTLISGAITTTGEVLTSNKLLLGRDPDVNTVSALVIVEDSKYKGPDGDVLALSDPAINIDPSAEELADIAISAAKTSKRILNWTPRTAFLSFSTMGSACHPDVEKVSKAVKIAQSKNSSFIFDGEMQLDAELSPRVAKTKVNRESDVAGKANVLIFPDLNAGNIAIKLCQELAGAKVYCSFIQGFRKTICDLSRGCTTENVVEMIILMAADIFNRRS